MTAKILPGDDFPLYIYHEGKNYKSYEFMGAHRCTLNETDGCIFRVWAPRAISVSVVGDFNNWNKTANVMARLNDGETFELFIPNIVEGDVYKYNIVTKDGRNLQKADPYAFYAEKPSATGSRIYDLDGYVWQDEEYIKNVQKRSKTASPMNIYEVNLLSWKMHDDGTYYTYKELAIELVDYVKEMGYTHVEFMPVSEHPFDGSWGYQVTGYFSVTSRLGEPKDFMKLIDAFHREGIGVILDWVPAHFPKDAHGLFEFDGDMLYECPLYGRTENRGWGTRCFDYGREEIISFLTSSAYFYFEKYHIDGMRVDAVSAMLYLDYEKKKGEWIPNQYGENKNLEAIKLLQTINRTIREYFPQAIMIAEESSAWEGVTKPVDQGGLGFDYKWCMGWMHDSLHYFSTDPYFRNWEHYKLTFAMTYIFSEQFILPISHDEVVHCKGSVIGKMPGEIEDKFAGVRAFLGYMISHPGKKLNFMGYEFGQFKEWNYAEGLEFFLKRYPLHEKLSDYVKDINHFYIDHSEFYEVESSWDGFEWLAADDKDQNTYAYVRRNRAGDEIVVILCLSGIMQKNYRLGIKKGTYKVIFNSDDEKYGGEGTLAKKEYITEDKPSHGKETSIEIDIPKHCCLYMMKTAEAE